MHLNSPAQILQDSPVGRSAFHTHNQTASSPRSSSEHLIEQCSYTPVDSGVPWTPSGSYIVTYYVNQQKQEGVSFLLVPRRKEKHHPTSASHLG